MCTLGIDPEKVNVRKVLGQEQKECFKLKGAARLSIGQVLALPSVGLLLTLQFLVYLAFNLFYIGFPVHAAVALEWSLTEVGVFFAVMGSMMVLVQGPVLNRASRIVSDRVSVLTGTLILAASFPFFSDRSTPMIYAGAALLALGNGLMWPSLLAILSKASDQSVQGAVQGFASSSAAVASIVGLLVGGMLYSAIGARVFLISAAMTALVFILAFAIPRKARKPSAA
jgi:MFS family permease